MLSKTNYPIACLNCREKHYKCLKELPSCSTCTTKGVKCVYVPPKRNTRRARSETEDTLHVKKQPRYDTAIESDEGSPEVLQLMQIIGNKICRSLTYYERIEEYSERIQHALVCIHYATVFQRAPCIQNAPLMKIDEFYNIVTPHSELVGMAYSQLHCTISERAKQLTRSQMKSLSQNLFSIAKETMLQPDIYSCLPRDHRLTRLAMRIVNYLLALGHKEKTIEGRMLVVVADLYMEYNGISALHSGVRKDEQAVVSTREIVSYLTDAQLMILIFEKFKKITSLAGIIEIFTVAIEYYENKAQWYANPSDLLETLNTLYHLKNVLIPSEEESQMNDLQILYRFLQATKLIGQQPTEENKLQSYVCIIGGELITCRIVAEQYKDNEAVTNIIRGLKRDIARKLTLFCRENSYSLQLFGAWNAWPYILACEENCDYADELLASSEYNEGLSSLLGLLQANIVHLDSLSDKYDVEECSEMSKRVKQRVSEICRQQMKQIELSVTAFSISSPPVSLNATDQQLMEELITEETSNDQENDILNLFMMDFDQLDALDDAL